VLRQIKQKTQRVLAPNRYFQDFVLS
jgi:hypothetical protein